MSSQDPDAAVLRAELKATASSRSGVMCSEGMVDRALGEQWASVDDSCIKAEKQRQALQQGRAKEVNALAKAKEGHRLQVGEVCVAKRRILDEMRAVRITQEDKVMSARGRCNHNMGVANRALARAGKNALTARGESERWQARAQHVEASFSDAKAREAEVLATMQEASRARASEADELSANRMQLGERLVSETSRFSEQVQHRIEERCRTQELHAHRAAQLKVQGAEGARQDAAVKVRSAVAKSSKEQMGCIGEIQRSREVASSRVAQARQDFLDSRMECEAVIEQERICAAQARKIALTRVAQQESDRDVEVLKLEAKFAFAKDQAQTTVANFEFEREAAAQRNQAWAGSNEANRVSAKARISCEDESAISRVNKAKVSLARLQAQCAAYIRNLLDHWEESKKEDAAKVEAASARLEELVRLCEQTLQDSDVYCGESLKVVESRAQAKTVQLEEKVEVMNSLAKERVAMMLRQSKERREKAEAQLAGFLAHVEDVRTQCDERVLVEAEAADEKVMMARERFAAEVALAERRQLEAEARRDVARVSHAAVMARCIGSAMEARRRGVNNIADTIEPEPPKRYPSSDAVAELPNEGGITEDVVAFENGEPRPFTAESKDGLMGTGITAASTALPDDLAASLATANEEEA